MNDIISNKLSQLKPSATLAVTNLANKLRDEGKDIIGLGCGEPDFDTPDSIKQAAIDAIQAGMTKYTAAGGTPALKTAIITKLKRDNDLDYTAEQVIASNGCKQSIFNLCNAILNPGDEVIIPKPYWVSYPAIVELTGAKVVTITTNASSNYKISAADLKAAITAKTKLIFLNSPSNPTGQAYSKTELLQLAAVLEQHPKIIIASDEIYEYVYWGKEKLLSIANISSELKARTVVLNGVSKSFAMTGWRIGYAACDNKDIIKAMTKLQTQSTSSPSAISQAAATYALANVIPETEIMRNAFKQRHDFLVEELQKLPGLSVLASVGTFYLFPDASKFIANHPKLKDDSDFTTWLLEEAGLAVVPGSAFGLKNHFRLSFALDMASLQETVTRLKKALS